MELLLVPMKLCECGCGQPAPLAKETNARRNHVKGQPTRFIVGHWAKGTKNSQWVGGRIIDSHGYIKILTVGHPRADATNYVKEHILIAEHALGRPLPPQVEVHHVNEQRADNANGNLVICEDRAYHRLLHKRTRAYRTCGDASASYCKICKQFTQDILVKCGSRSFAHRTCKNKDALRRYHLRKESA